MDKSLLKIFYLPILMIILIVIWIFTYYMPIQEQNKQLFERMTLLNGKVQQEVPEVKVSMMQIMVDSLKVKLNSNTQRLYPESELLNLGKLIESTCQKYDLKLVALSPDYKTLAVIASENTEISKMPLKIEVEGRFMQMAKMLDDLPNFPFVYQLEGFNILKESSSSIQLKIELNGMFLLKKDNKTNQSKLVMNKKSQASS